MRWNWVFIAVLLLLAWEMIRGYQRGLLRTVYSFLSWLITLVFVMWASPYIETYLLEHTSLREKIEERCTAEIRDTIEHNAPASLAENPQYESLAELGLHLPDGVLDRAIGKTGETAFGFLESKGIYEGIGQGMAEFVIEGISFFIAAAAAWILLHFTSKMLGIVSKIPVVHGINKILGIFAGALYALILIWIAFYLAALSGTSEFGKMVISYIYQNPFLQFLYENNLIITVLLKQP